MFIFGNGIYQCKCHVESKEYIMPWQKVSILPQKFKQVNQKTQVQVFGLSFFVVSVIFVLLFVNSFQKILNYVMFFDTIGLSTAAASIFILRKKTKHLDKTGIYTIKWYPAILFHLLLLTGLLPCFFH